MDTSDSGITGGMQRASATLHQNGLMPTSQDQWRGHFGFQLHQGGQNGVRELPHAEGGHLHQGHPRHALLKLMKQLRARRRHTRLRGNLRLQHVDDVRDLDSPNAHAEAANFNFPLPSST